MLRRRAAAAAARRCCRVASRRGAAAAPRVLCVNPNTSSDFTAKLAAAVAGTGGGAVVECVQPDAGPRSIESAYDEALSAPPSLDLLL
eukprot:gene15637-6549_t